MPLELKKLQVKIHVLLGPANSVAVRCRQLEQFFESQNKGKFIILLETATAKNETSGRRSLVANGKSFIIH